MYSFWVNQVWNSYYDSAVAQLNSPKLVQPQKNEISKQISEKLWGHRRLLKQLKLFMSWLYSNVIINAETYNVT